MWINIGSATKKDIQVKVTPQELSVHVQDIQILQGLFKHSVQADTSTWILSKDLLPLYFTMVSFFYGWGNM